MAALRSTSPTLVSLQTIRHEELTVLLPTCLASPIIVTAIPTTKSLAIDRRMTVAFQVSFIHLVSSFHSSTSLPIFSA